ncbi:MAG: foldase [Firmicutes bacterium]|nr:foldase [Bacillota bacterium]
MDTMEKKRESAFLKPQNIILAVLALVILGAAAVIISMQFNPTVAVVNGKKIKRSELYEAMYTEGGKETLEGLVFRQLIIQEAKKCGVTVSDEEIDAEIDTVIGEHFMGAKEQFDSFLAQQGYSLQMIQDNARINIMARKIVEADLEISEADALEYFNENKENYDIPEEVRARHILVKTEEEALEAISRLEKEEDFAELAKELSTDPGSKDQGGDLGFFPRGRMVKEFEEVAFALGDGERSEPVKSTHGYHIIETLERKEGRAVTYEEVAEKVKEEIRGEKVPLLIHELIERLEKEAVIDYRD